MFTYTVIDNNNQNVSPLIISFSYTHRVTIERWTANIALIRLPTRGERPHLFAFHFSNTLHYCLSSKLNSGLISSSILTGILFRSQRTTEKNMDQVTKVLEPGRQFSKDSVRLVKRCTKPDRKGNRDLYSI